MTEQKRVKLQMLVLVAAMGVGIPAHAQPVPDTSVHGVIAVGGPAADEQRAAANEGVRSALTSAGWGLPELPLPKADADRMLNCATPAEPWRCVPGKLGQQQISRAMIVKVEPKSATTGLPWVAVTEIAVSTTKNVFVVLQWQCEQCTTDKLKETARALAVQLVKDLASRAGDTAIEVVSEPTDAEVTLDGQKAAATGNTFTTFPGEHVVVISKTGYADETRTVQVKEGKTARVSVMLRASVREQRHASRVVPIAAFATGGAGLVGAGILIYLGQRSGSDDRTEYRRATALGITSGVVGLAAIGAGIYLWHRGTAASSPTLGITSAGTPVLGWTRTF